MTLSTEKLKQIRMAVFVLFAFYMAVQTDVFGAERSQNKHTLEPLSGEQTVTFMTRDDVRIVGSLFMPAEVIEISIPTLSELIFGVGIWNELEKEFLAFAAPVRKGTVTRIIVKDGHFSFSREKFYNEKIIRVEPPEEVKAENGEKKSSEKTGEIQESFIPLLNRRSRIDPFDRILSPYGAIEESFVLKISSSPSPEPEKEKEKKEEKVFFITGGEDRGFQTTCGFQLFQTKRSQLLKNSCFYQKTVTQRKKCYPGVILFHMWRRDRHEWRTLVPHLQKAGFVVLTIDLRGHGESVIKKGKKIDVKNFVTQNYRNMVDDAFSAYEFLISQDSVDSKKISVVGASLGTVVAIKLCEKVNTIKPASPIRSLTVLSPSKNFFAVKVEDSIKNCEQTAMLFIMDKKDPSPERNDIFVSGCALYNKFNGSKEALIFDGAGHGTAMLESRSELKSVIVDWIRIHSKYLL
ncbi:MAG: alpha/beta fold hydrolase [Candidatus Aureabacteria bacterium]|nr:alpha/beta fold hydrolase [Candidatus Auribacterota bacterium]